MKNLMNDDCDSSSSDQSDSEPDNESENESEKISDYEPEKPSKNLRVINLLMDLMIKNVF